MPPEGEFGASCFFTHSAGKLNFRQDRLKLLEHQLNCGNAPIMSNPLQSELNSGRNDQMKASNRCAKRWPSLNLCSESTYRFGRH
jgi:hypothetical protein